MNDYTDDGQLFKNWTLPECDVLQILVGHSEKKNYPIHLLEVLDLLQVEEQVDQSSFHKVGHLDEWYSVEQVQTCCNYLYLIHQDEQTWQMGSISIILTKFVLWHYLQLDPQVQFPLL